MAYIASYLVVMVLGMTISSAAPFIVAASREENVGQVLFVEKAQQDFLRESRDSCKIEDTFSQEDIAATVSVLLGVSPPFKMSSASSAKLDTVLSSNPFRRPRTVLALTIRGINLDLLSAAEKKAIFGMSTVQQRLSAGNSRQFVLPGYNVDVQSLKQHQEGLTQGLKDLSNFLGGVLTVEGADEGSVDREMVVLTVPLVESISIALDLSKEADRKFANDLLSLYNILERAGARHDSRSVACLYSDSLFGVEAMENNLDAAKVLLFTAVKVLNGGQFVGMFAFPPSSSSSESARTDMMFIVTSPIRSRSLEESSQEQGALSPSAAFVKVDSSLIEWEIVILVRNSLVVATTLILLIATLLGTCYLVGMPLTRDTLLYSGAKLD